MDTQFSEKVYPVTFRATEAKVLGEHVRLRHNVELVGMLHVGIRNFLRFFLYQDHIIPTYINHDEKHMFVHVDLNDLVARDIASFWNLVFSRLVDSVEASGLDVSSKAQITKLFEASSKSADLFSTIDSLRKSVGLVVAAGILPTLFFVRFDRIKDAINSEFYTNLEGLRDSSGHQLAYVFTSFRPLNNISPEVFSKKSLSGFSHLMYVKPAINGDVRVVFDMFEKKYNLSLSDTISNKLLELVGGHVKYLHIAVSILKEKREGDLFENIAKNEKINFLSEEIWESLNTEEQRILTTIFKKGIKQSISEADKKVGDYLWQTGIIGEKNGVFCIFSPLFEYFIQQRVEGGKPNGSLDFTKKENLLYNFLIANIGQICEREQIITTVWGDDNAGVTDWTVDQLVARLRTKLKLQKSKYQVVTVKTRGYRMEGEGN